MENKKITAYKAFDKDLKCRGLQYEVGKEYEMEGDIKCCERGFHACESPLEIFDHYDMLTARFAKVEMTGKIDREDNSIKICSSKIKVKAELKLADIITLGIEWLKEKTSPTAVQSSRLNDNTENYAQIGSSGYYAKIGSSGYNAKIGSSGDYAQIGSSGYNAKIGSSGYNAKIGSSGDNAQIGSSGYYAKIGSSSYNAQIGSSGYNAQIGSSGYNAKIGSSGYNAKIGSSGDNAQIGSSGYYAKIGSSGYNAQIGSSGYNAKIGSSGDYAKIGSSGNSAQIGSSGDNAKIDSSGEHSVVMAAGCGSSAKAAIGSWITLAEWKYDGNKCKHIPVCVKTEQVDGERIKADTWYNLVNGKFEEVKE